MAALPIYRDTAKPKAAVPVTKGGASPGAAIPGEATASPIPITNSRAETYEQAFSRLVGEGWPPDLAAYALDGVDPWAARHNAEIWGAGDWRSDDATGFYE